MKIIKMLVCTLVCLTLFGCSNNNVQNVNSDTTNIKLTQEDIDNEIENITNSISTAVSCEAAIAQFIAETVGETVITEDIMAEFDVIEKLMNHYIVDITDKITSDKDRLKEILEALNTTGLDTENINVLFDESSELINEIDILTHSDELTTNINLLKTSMLKYSDHLQYDQPQLMSITWSFQYGEIDGDEYQEKLNEFYDVTPYFVEAATEEDLAKEFEEHGERDSSIDQVHVMVPTLSDWNYTVQPGWYYGYYDSSRNQFAVSFEVIENGQVIYPMDWIPGDTGEYYPAGSDTPEYVGFKGNTSSSTNSSGEHINSFQITEPTDSRYQVMYQIEVLTTVNVKESTLKDAATVGTVNKGDVYDVYSFGESESLGYTYYMIGQDQWVANDGTWIKELKDW